MAEKKPKKTDEETPVEAPVEAEALLTHARARLARFKCPRTVVFVDTIPRTSAGKIRRNVVREELMRRAAVSG